MVSRAKKRLVLAIGGVLVVVITTVGVLTVWPAEDAPAADTVQTAISLTNEFLDAFTTGNADGAGELTDDATATTTQLTDLWRTLAPVSGGASRAQLVEPPSDATTATQHFTLTWELALGQTWSYESSLPLARKDGTWLVHWQPTIVHPQLVTGQSLALKARAGQPAVLDADGAPLLAWADNGATATDPAVAPLLLPGMARAVGDQNANAGYIALVDDTGAELAVVHGEHAPAHTSTLRRSVQQAAQAAVDAQQFPAMLVALQPSTGDLLAVAQNAAVGAEPVALTGLYPPGSTFKVATATALLDAGIGVDTVVPCPGVTTVGQRTVRNADFELGDVPLRTAFAESCNTTFAIQAGELSPEALPSAAHLLGLGADFDVPGLTTVVGRVPAAADQTEQVENSIGQGTVQASCFGVALMSATVAAGRAVTPRLWRDLETTVHTGYEAPSASVIGGLRKMMRQVVSSGRGSELAKYGAVHGKTGTAQVGDGTQAHGWFTGYRDDIAFAVLTLDSNTSTTAVSVTATFLAATN